MRCGRSGTGGGGIVTLITAFGSLTDLVLIAPFWFFELHFQAEYFFTPMKTDFPMITKPGRLLPNPTPKKK